MRKFRSKNGFLDGTDYVAVDEDGSFLVNKYTGDVTRLEGCYSISECEKLVRMGLWVEIDAEKSN